MFSEADLRELAAFQVFACEGMSYSLDPEHLDHSSLDPSMLQPPLVNRCMCGRRISANKHICLGCLQAARAARGE